jgi:uncharacterized membrane protein
MSQLTVVIIITSILGAGLVTGLLFAFSNFVMKALADLPSDQGMLAMQKINVAIINPVFMLLFLGTPLLSCVITFAAIQSINEPGSLCLLIGALAYIVGPFGVTMLFNVPLNNMLASTDLVAADDIWPMYQKKWQLWNHIRTSIGVVSIVLMSIGLSSIESI